LYLGHSSVEDAGIFLGLWLLYGDGKMAAMLRCMMRQRLFLDGAMLPDLL
jgi:hypothetical protein